MEFQSHTKFTGRPSMLNRESINHIPIDFPILPDPSLIHRPPFNAGKKVVCAHVRPHVCLTSTILISIEERPECGL